MEDSKNKNILRVMLPDGSIMWREKTIADRISEMLYGYQIPKMMYPKEINHPEKNKNNTY